MNFTQDPQGDLEKDPRLGPKTAKTLSSNKPADGLLTWSVDWTCILHNLGAIVPNHETTPMGFQCIDNRSLMGVDGGPVKAAGYNSLSFEYFGNFPQVFYEPRMIFLVFLSYIRLYLCPRPRQDASHKIFKLSL